MRRFWRWLTSRTAGRGDGASVCPRWLQCVVILYLVALPILAVMYAKWHAFARVVPSSLGPIPIAVLFFGALGGLYISLLGVIFHGRRRDDTYNLWHAVRPLTGALTAAIGFLIFVVVIDSTGAKAAKHATATYDLIGFLIGYGESAFLQLLKRATDTLLGPGDASKVGQPKQNENDPSQHGPSPRAATARRATKTTT